MPVVANPIQVQKFLKGIDYPAPKRQLVETARRHGADENVIYTLEQLPDRTFDSPTAIAKEIGKLR